MCVSQEEAELRCKMLRQEDSNHDVYVGPVGMWMPFHPEAYKTGRVEYLEKELNELMAKKKQNDEVSKEQFKKRVQEEGIIQEFRQRKEFIKPSQVRKREKAAGRARHLKKLRKDIAQRGF